jgi:hypothetical protein
MTTVNPTIAFREPLKVPSRNVRDGIIKAVKELFPNQTLPPFAIALTKHLKEMGYDKLDMYKNLTFILDEFKVTLEIITTAKDGEELNYVIPKGTVIPPEELRRTKFLGLF